MARAEQNVGWSEHLTSSESVQRRLVLFAELSQELPKVFGLDSRSGGRGDLKSYAGWFVEPESQRKILLKLDEP